MQEFATLDDAIGFLKAHMHEDLGRANTPKAERFLGESGDDKAYLPLLEALRSGGAYHRSAAALGLGYLGKRDAIPELEKAFVKDPGVYVRCDAALALGYLRAEESLPILLDSFPNENFEVQKRIVMVIAKFEPASAEPALAALETMLSPDSTPRTIGSRGDFLRYLIVEAR